MINFFKSKKKLRQVGEKIFSEKLAIKRLPMKNENQIDNHHILCQFCERKLIFKEVYKNFLICTACDAYFRLTPNERINLTFDAFEEINENIFPSNPLKLPEYQIKLDNLKEKFNYNSGVVSGLAKIKDQNFIAFILNPFFIMGSLGSAEGKKISLAFEYANKNKLPVVGFITSGGARMQEGMFSLMQMANTSAAIASFAKKRLFYLAILSSPTFGGVTASFGTLADITIAEPKAMIGFAGRRVIEQTAKIKLPKNFQTAEFLEEKGFIDLIVERKNLKLTIYKLLKIHSQ